MRRNYGIAAQIGSAQARVCVTSNNIARVVDSVYSGVNCARGVHGDVVPIRRAQETVYHDWVLRQVVEVASRAREDDVEAYNVASVVNSARDGRTGVRKIDRREIPD